MTVMQQIPEELEISLVGFLPEFFEAFTKHIEESQERWGNEWLRRPILENSKHANQDARIYGRFDSYWEQFEEDGVLIDRETWLKIIGNAFIATVRLNHPELFPNGYPHPYYKTKE